MLYTAGYKEYVSYVYEILLSAFFLQKGYYVMLQEQFIEVLKKNKNFIDK